MKKHAWLIALVFFGVQTFLYLRDFFYIDGYGLSIMVFLSGWAILLGVWLHKPADKAPWVFMAIGHMVFSGAILFPYDPGPPGIADVFYLGMHPYLLVSLILFTWSRDRARDAIALLDSIIVGLGLAAFTLNTALIDHWTSGYTTDLSILFSAYTIAFTTLLIAAVRLGLTAGRWHWAYGALLFSFFAINLAELGAAIYTFDPESFSYTLAYRLPVAFFFAVAPVIALHPSMTEVSRAGTPYDKWPLKPWRHWLIAVCGSIPVILMVFVENHVVVHVLVMIMFACMMLRFHLVRKAYLSTLQYIRKGIIHEEDVRL